MSFHVFEKQADQPIHDLMLLFPYHDCSLVQQFDHHQ
jgi:hypothetical protein